MDLWGKLGIEKGRMYDLEDCVNVVRQRFVLGRHPVSVGKVHGARLFGTITHTPLRSLMVFSGGAAIVARV